MVQCDVSVHQGSTMYNEICLLFKNVNLTINDIGEHMKNYLKDNDLPTSDMVTLVGGVRAKQILFVTPFVQWYLSKGFSVSNVTLVIEYKARSL